MTFSWEYGPKDEKTHVPMMFSSMLSFHVVATLCMCLRFYSKRVSRCRYFVDDYVLIASWVVATVYVFIALWMTRLGLGYTFLKAFQLFPEGAVTRIKFVPIVTFAAITACWISKLSFFITLIRLVSGRWQKATLWFLMTSSTVCLTVLSFLMSVKECTDFHELGLPPDRENCINLRVTRAFGIFASVYATVMNFILSVVPSFVMWKLKLPRHDKVAIICAMSTGCFAGGVSIMKVWQAYQVLDEGVQEDSPSLRDPYKGGLVYAFASVEVSCTIIAASIPFFRPLIPRLMAKNEDTPEEPRSMDVTPGSCKGHIRLESAGGRGQFGFESNRDSCVRTTEDDDSVQISEFDRKL